MIWRIDFVRASINTPFLVDLVPSALAQGRWWWRERTVSLAISALCAHTVCVPRSSPAAGKKNMGKIMTALDWRKAAISKLERLFRRLSTWSQPSTSITTPRQRHPRHEPVIGHVPGSQSVSKSPAAGPECLARPLVDSQGLRVAGRCSATFPRPLPLPLPMAILVTLSILDASMPSPAQSLRKMSHDAG